MQPNDKTWWETAFPPVTWLRSYDRTWFRLDLLAGVTLAAYLLPAALGDASLANLPPQAGLYACLFGGLIFWIFCGSRFPTVLVTFPLFPALWSSPLEVYSGDAVPLFAPAGPALLLACPLP